MPLPRRRRLSLFLGALLVQSALGLAFAADLDFKKAPVLAEVRAQLEFVGWRFDDKSGRVLDTQSQPLSEERYAAYRQPCDFFRTEIPDGDRAALTYGGHRFEEETGHILAPQTKKPLSRLDVEQYRKYMLLNNKHVILERLSHLLAAQDPAKPLSADARARVKALTDFEKAALPPALAKALESPRTLAGALKGQAERAYLDSTRFFDGQGTLSDKAKADLPVWAGGGDGRQKPNFFDDTEKRLGEALRDAVAAHLAKDPVGRDLLSHFKGKDGKPELPPFLILKIGPNAGAVYNITDRTVIFNQQYMVEGLLANKPPEAAEGLRQELSDPKKFARYLLAHPKAQEDFLVLNDVAVFHELIHARQDRRDRLMGELNRGNTPSAIYIEYEQEAFLQQNRYVHSKVLRGEAVTPKELDNYRQMLGDFSRWKDGIKQTYTELWPQAAATIGTAQALQKERIGAARRLMGESLHSAMVQTLKLIGYEQGSQAMAQAQKGSQARLAAFKKDEYPAMKKQAARPLAERFLALARGEKNRVQKIALLDSAAAYAELAEDAALLKRIAAERQETP